MTDNWEGRNRNMICGTCMYFVEKRSLLATTPEEDPRLGRCRHNAPTLDGWPVIFSTDWCGQHKLDEDKLIDYNRLAKIEINEEAIGQMQNVLKEGMGNGIR